VFALTKRVRLDAIALPADQPFKKRPVRRSNHAFDSYPFGEAAHWPPHAGLASRLGAPLWRATAFGARGDWCFTLVREAPSSSRARSTSGDQAKSSLTRANAMWRRTRRTVEATVK
jgi:hypothetical protein